MIVPVRVFCQSQKPPTWARLRAFAANRGLSLSLDRPHDQQPHEEADWESAAFIWRPQHPPVFVEIHAGNGSDVQHFHADLAEAVSHLRQADAEVRAAIAATRFIADLHLPHERGGDAAWHVVDTLATALEIQANGLRWQVGTGFWRGGHPL